METPTSAFAALHCTCKAQTCTFEALHCPFEAQDCPFEAPKHRSVDVGAVSIQKFFQGLAAPGPPPILLGAKKEGTGQHFLALRRKEGKSEGEGKVFAQPGRQTLRPSPSLLPSFHRARARGLAPVAWGHHHSPTQAISTPKQIQDSFALQNFKMVSKYAKAGRGIVMAGSESSMIDSMQITSPSLSLSLRTVLSCYDMGLLGGWVYANTEEGSPNA